MRDIAAIEPNGLKVASTFSGAGGSCLGYRMAGFKVLYASEFIPEAAATYRANHPDSYLDTRDIRATTAKDVLVAAGVDVGELDVLDGSPPCSAFSTAGKREKGWGQSKEYSDGAIQVVDDLFWEYIRLVRGIRPKVFVAENVAGLVKGTAKGYFKRILAEFRACGYLVAAKLLNAAWLGVPQGRERLIFVGVRSDLKQMPVHPAPFQHIYSLGEAVADLQGLPLDQTDARRLKPGTDTYHFWRSTRPGNTLADACQEQLGKTSFLTHTKCSPTTVAPTITAIAQAYHWEEPRTLSIPEVKRACSFPDDFVLTGDFMQRWERLGRAVPPLMMKAVADTIRDRILLPTDSARVPA